MANLSQSALKNHRPKSNGYRKGSGPGLRFEESDQGADGLPRFARKQAQKGPEVGQDFPHVVPGAEEDDVRHDSNHALDEIPSED